MNHLTIRLFAPLVAAVLASGAGAQTQPAPVTQPAPGAPHAEHHPYADPAMMSEQERMAMLRRRDRMALSYSELSARDQQLLDEFYAEQMRTAAVLRARLEAAQRAGDPEQAAFYGNMLTEHLILASRARQVYQASLTPFPPVITEVTVAGVTGEQWWDQPLQESRATLGRAQASASQASDPRVRNLLMGAQETLARQEASAPRYVAGLIVPPVDAVAGVRIEQGDPFVLNQFYTMQMDEVGRLQAQARRLREANQAELADEFERMAAQHRALADRAAALMRERQLSVPAPAEHPEISGSPEVIVRHTLHHHEAALPLLAHLHTQAQDPQIRELIAMAIQGTEGHARALRSRVGQ